MKRTLILAAAVALCSCSSNRYTIEGKIEGLTGVVYLCDDQNNTLDSAAVSGGAFRLTGQAETPAIRVVRSTSDESPFAAMVILEPGKITIADNPENPYRKRVSGTPSNDASAAYSEASNALIQEFRNEETSDERREAIEKEYEQLTRTTFEANRTNFFGALLLAQQLAYEMSGQELLDEIAALPAEMQQSDLLVKLRENAEAKLRTDIGQPYIDVVQPDASGAEVSLRSVVENPANKYVLLDFWASWCGPCMGEVPYLKQAYADYHKKGFEIYGVSFDRNREDWLQAIDENDMKWIHVSALSSFDNQAGKDYAVQGIPSNFLIDAEGKIVAKNLRGEALAEKLAELLGK